MHVHWDGKDDWKPWLTLFLDEYSRALMGWAISLRPTAAEVLAALRGAVLIDPEFGPFGGVPDVIRPDNGLEFLATDVTRAAVRIGSVALPTDRYAPHQKGKVERVNRTISDEFVRELPFAVDGPRRANRSLYGPSSGPMTLELLVAEFAAYVGHYNLERPHRGLDGRTPHAVWQADATPIRTINAADLRFMVLAEESRIIGKDGIRFRSRFYFAPELDGRVGQRIGVRYVPHDARSIEVELDGRWLCTAYPQDTLTADQRKDALIRRQQERTRAAGLMREASRRVRARIAPITTPGREITDIRVITHAEADGETQVVDERTLRDRANTDLLGLDDYLGGSDAA